MDSRFKVTIGKAEQVLNCTDTVRITNHYSADGRLQSRTHGTLTGQNAQSRDGGSLMPDGPLSASPPPQQGASPADQNGEAELRAPVQTNPSSADGERYPGMALQEDRRREETQLRAPVPVEGSTDYISVGREYDPGGLNGASPSDPTEMSELKTPFPEDNTAESHGYGETPVSMTEPSGQYNVEDTDLKQAARPGGQHPGIPQQHHGAANDSPHHMTELKHVAQSANADPNLVSDGPEQTPPLSSLEDEMSVSSGSTSGQNVQSQSDSALDESELDIGNGDASTESIEPIENDGNCEKPPAENDDRLFVTASGRNVENGNPQQATGSSESQGEETRTSLLSLGSDPTSLQTDGGGEGRGQEQNIAEDVFVFVHRKMLIPDPEDTLVSIVEVSPSLSVLEDGRNEGALPGGSSQLAQLKWVGHRDFVLSQWKMTLSPDTSQPNQTPDFIRHLCNLFLDWDLRCFREVVKQLKVQHDIFLHSLNWDGGLVIHLGHANPLKRETCLKLPDREGVCSILQQLVSGCDVDLVWQDPIPLEEEDTEDGRPPDLPERVEHVSSVRSSEMFGTGQTTRRREDALNLSSQQQPPPAESRFSDQNSASNSKASSLVQLLSDIVEEKCSSLVDEHKSRLESGDKQQLKQQLMNLVECERQKLEQTVQDLRHDLEKCRSTNHILSQNQEQVYKRQAEMMQLMNEMRTCLQVQNETVEEMKRAGNRTEKRQEEREAAEEEMKQQMKTLEEDLKVMKERPSQLQQDQAHALEETSNRYQLVMAELRKQQEQFKRIQQELMQQKQRQEELSTSLAEHKETVHRLRTAQPGRGASIVVGAVQEEEEGVEGAVGGGLSRNRYSSALVESEQTTSKMKGKDEEMGSNQIEEKIHPMGTAGDSLGEMLEVPRVKTGVPRLPAAIDTEPASDERPYNDNMTSGIVSAQGGARSKTSQKPPQRDTDARGSNSVILDRKMTSSRENSQDRKTGSTSSEEPEEEVFTKAEQFLEWVQFSGGPKDLTKSMMRQITYALKEEDIPAPRAKCLDTILCIDVSDSIVSHGHLETVRNTALDFVDGIEDLMNEMDMEENIGVVAMGGNARVLQHLTNDLTLVREAIESLDSSGGRSPFIQALIVCLAANKGRGGVVNVAGMYKVPPRVIFITDGCPTDESQETGPDLPSNINQTKFSLVNLLSQFAARKRKSMPKPINWVPIGHQVDKQFMESLAALSGGELVMPEDIRSLCRHYKLQQTIGRLLKMVKNQNDNIIQDDKVRELLDAMAFDTITAKEKESVMEAVKKLLKCPDEEDDPEADDFNNIFEDEVKVKNGQLLALGTRVVRGPHWKWKNQDTDGPGTVIYHSRKDNWMYVKWDNGMHNAYRYGEGGKTDVVETQHHPRQIAPDSDRLDFGVRVVRGPDWNRDNNEDSRGPGSVIRCRESDGKVKVRWDITGTIHEYNHSRSKGREVQFMLPEFPRHGHSFNHSSGHNIEQHDADKTIAMWKWRDNRRQWRLYDEATCDKLEAEYRKRPGASCIVTRAGTDRRVSFKLMQEKAVDGGAYTDVTREMVDEERKNDLLAIEMSLNE